MIFVTVGSQAPFDRLIRIVDDWAMTRGRTDVYAQIGSSAFQPKCIEATRFLSPAEFQEKVAAASLVVAHAGMGTIITALELGKPIIVLPRRGDIGETRGDHQIATAGQLATQGRVVAAVDDADLVRKLDQVDTLRSSAPAAIAVSPHLIAVLSAFIAQNPLPVLSPAGPAAGLRPTSAE